MTLKGLNTAQGPHHAPGGTADISTDTQCIENIKGREDLAGRQHSHILFQVIAPECINHKYERFLPRHADVFRKVDRRRTGATFGGVDSDEIRFESSGTHLSADIDELVSAVNAER
ncbi:hypothetical protein GCM10022278_37600 [Allohahella marinimesophila]|uniref:Uncharacterized protein n=1 Tax=Allohahella marinimesophila TaxID=1054972 RepID=A0ABP7Q710_9GAMM